MRTGADSRATFSIYEVAAAGSAIESRDPQFASTSFDVGPTHEHPAAAELRSQLLTCDNGLLLWQRLAIWCHLANDVAFVILSEDEITLLLGEEVADAACRLDYVRVWIGRNASSCVRAAAEKTELPLDAATLLSGRIQDAVD
jgi:hypothetical protein